MICEQKFSREHKVTIKGHLLVFWLLVQVGSCHTLNGKDQQKRLSRKPRSGYGC